MMLVNSQRKGGSRNEGAPLRKATRWLPAGLGAALLLLTQTASAQVVNYYAGTNSAGKDVEIYTTAYGQGTVIYGFEITGDRYCNGILVPAALLGGNTDGTQYHPIIDGRATFVELRPDYFLSVDLQFSGTKVKGSATFKQAMFTGPDFPPKDRDAASCTTKKLSFTATYVGSETAARVKSIKSATAPNVTR